jgi:tetratricopeptide (TPR) repeat protein
MTTKTRWEAGRKGRGLAVGAALLAALAAAPASAQSFAELDAARAAVSASPSDAGAQLRLGYALLEARDLAGAKNAFEAALRARADWVDALWGLARIRMAEGNYEESRTACRRVIAEAGNTAAAGHICMGQAYLVWRRSSLAIEEFNKALEAAPGNAEALSGIGDAYARLNQLDNGIEYYQQAVAADGNLLEARLGLALMLERKGDKAGAIAQLNAALSARSWSADAHYNLGRLLDDAEQAIPHLAQAVTIRPSFADAQAEYGRRLSTLGRFAEAIPPLRAALAQLPNVAQMSELLGIALWKTGSFDEAETLLRAAIAGVPNSARANEALGEVLVAKGKTDDGLALLETAANLDARNPLLPFRIAEIAHAQGRNTYATGYLDRALQHQPNLSRAHALYGDILFEQGRYAEARTYYQNALAGDGAAIDAAFVRNRLGQIDGMVPRQPGTP